MILEIRNRIESEIARLLSEAGDLCRLKEISGVLYNNIKEFILRDGKRIRPLLFMIGYMGFTSRRPAGLYRSAVSLELIHDFTLIHDDIIDRSDERRNAPSMHSCFNKLLKERKGIKFTGADLAMITGDIIFAVAIRSFTAIKEEPKRKEAGLGQLLSAAIHTGSGEFIELTSQLTPLDNTSRQDIINTYDLKTAHYSFAAPLSIGATLAGAKKAQADKLFRIGILLGRAFQIQDDIMDMTGTGAGKKALNDVKESKRTIIIWHAYNRACKQDKTAIARIFSKPDPSPSDLAAVRKIALKTGAVALAEKEIGLFIKQAEELIAATAMDNRYKGLLVSYSKGLYSPTR